MPRFHAVPSEQHLDNLVIRLIMKGAPKAGQSLIFASCYIFKLIVLPLGYLGSSICYRSIIRNWLSLVAEGFHHAGGAGVLS